VCNKDSPSQTINYPPLDIEEALDLILACAAHTSKLEGQREFARILFDQFFVRLRSEQTDSRAKAYLNHLLPIVASAVRAFAVQRQIFETQRESVEARHAERLKYVDGWTGYSPLNQSGVLYRLAGPGLLGPVVGGLFATWKPAQSFWALGIIAGAALGYLAIDIALRTLRQSVINRLYRELPESIEVTWQDTVKKYRQILTNFLLLSIKVRERYYPELPCAIPGAEGMLYKEYDIPHVQFESLQHNRTALPQEVISEIERIVDRHFSF